MTIKDIIFKLPIIRSMIIPKDNLLTPVAINEIDSCQKTVNEVTDMIRILFMTANDLSKMTIYRASHINQLITALNGIENISLPLIRNEYVNLSTTFSLNIQCIKSISKSYNTLTTSIKNVEKDFIFLKNLVDEIYAKQHKNFLIR